MIYRVSTVVLRSCCGLSLKFFGAAAVCNLDIAGKYVSTMLICVGWCSE